MKTVQEVNFANFTQALGTTGLALILLSPKKRHIVLYPLEETPAVEVFSAQWEDTIQLLIGNFIRILLLFISNTYHNYKAYMSTLIISEYWLPSFAYWVLGAMLILTAVTVSVI